jgi:alpha-1,3-rhamnosyl/mannosyltransferase
MRTVIDVRTINDHFPGIGRYAYQLVCALARQDHRDELVLLSNPENSGSRFSIAALASAPNLKIIHTTARPFTVREQLRLPGELRRINPGTTHFPYMVMPYAAPRPIVLTIHDIIPVRLPHFFPIRQRAMYRISLLLALRSAAVVICDSEATRSDLKSSFRMDLSRLSVIHAGVAESFRPCPGKELDRVQAGYGLPPEYLLYVGSNKPHKNLPALIDALSILPNAPPLVIAGETDPRYSETHRRIDRSGLSNRVRFLGAVKEEDLPGLYSGARAFVFPSLYEGFGLPPLEAMACGVPVACSGIPCLREIAGDAALFFNPKDRDSMAAAIERILTDQPLRADLQNRGLRRASEMSWDATAKQALQVYQAAYSGR